MVRRHAFLNVAAHLLLVPLAFVLAFALHGDGGWLAREHWHLLAFTLPIVVAARLTALAVFGLFHGYWRHAGMQDLLDLVKAVTLSSLWLAGAILLSGNWNDFPLSVLFIDWFLATGILGGVRFATRGLAEGRWPARRAPNAKRTLVIGAGEAAEGLLRQLQHDGNPGFQVIGLIDDDPAKKNLRLHGVPVLGDSNAIRQVVDRLGIQFLIIAIPSATRGQIQQVIQQCAQAGIDYKIVPSLRELVQGRSWVDQLRPVEITDLLGRGPVELDLNRVSECIRGKTILITGGAGSIGSELALQIAALEPERLVLVDQAESRLYFVQLEIQDRLPGASVVSVIADITDPAHTEQILSRWRPQYLFHAAAYKHVPLLEDNVAEAVHNNVFGTLSVVQAAVRHGVGTVVLISTDKAVRPSSVMGATKRIAERITLGWPSILGQGTDGRAVRFGNVLDSDGSVVPVFRQQLARGGPITVTHPDVTRYFMTIPEAVQLILQAAVLPEGKGRIAMLEMGEPVPIVGLAENLIRLSGFEPYTEVPIVFTGLRPGEKLSEELMTELEVAVPTTVEKIRVARTNGIDTALLDAGLRELASGLQYRDRVALLAALHGLVPECTPPLREHGERAHRMVWRIERRNAFA